MASKPRHSSRTSDEWVVVAKFYNDADADLAVSLLKGSGLPVTRYPVSSLGATGYGFLADAVGVLVPPNRAEAAQELLKEAEIEPETPEARG